MDNEDTVSTIPSPATSLTSLASVDPDVKHDEFFYFDIVVFRAQKTLFRVPRYGLPADGAAFDRMFSREPGGPGSSDENPIQLGSDVTAFDFRSLLKAVYPPLGTATITLNLEEAMSVLKLAKKWDLASVRDKAVAQSDARIQEKTAVEKILLAKKYGVVKWLQEGYRALVSRDTAITDEEMNKLGLETFARLMIAREKSFAWAITTAPPTTHSCGGSLYCSYCGRSTPCSTTPNPNQKPKRDNFAYDATIRDVFGDELKE